MATGFENIDIQKVVKIARESGRQDLRQESRYVDFEDNSNKILE